MKPNYAVVYKRPTITISRSDQKPPSATARSQFIAHDVFPGELFHGLFVEFAFNRRRNHRALHAKLAAGCCSEGGSLDVHACFLLQRGWKTLSPRMRQHDEHELRLARFLAEQAQVARVNYPGLENHPQYERAQRLFARAGGVLSFELYGGVEAAERLLSKLVLPASAPSLGGVETCGIEAAEDLCADFAQALVGV